MYPAIPYMEKVLEPWIVIRIPRRGKPPQHPAYGFQIASAILDHSRFRHAALKQGVDFAEIATPHSILGVRVHSLPVCSDQFFIEALWERSNKKSLEFSSNQQHRRAQGSTIPIIYDRQPQEAQIKNQMSPARRAVVLSKVKSVSQGCGTKCAFLQEVCRVPIHVRACERAPKPWALA